MIPGMIKCSVVELRQSKSDGRWSDFRDCSSVTGADLRIARQGQGGSTRDPLHDSELAPNLANRSAPPAMFPRS